MDEKLIGVLSGNSKLNGTLSSDCVLTGKLSIPENYGTPYTGSYEVTPSDAFQLMPTAECYLTDDMLIHPIPYMEVSNIYGGLTVTIGG